ncbi:MAG: hypothetical protein AAB354_16845, partial [candidate division KSB1 bacterium]
MSQETMLATIHAELRHADAATMNAVLETLRRAKQTAQPPAKHAHDFFEVLAPKTQIGLRFIGDNPAYDPNRNLSLHERAALKRQLKAQNREWLLMQFQKLKAAWIMVLEGQVSASGATLESYPKPEQILEVCQRTRKFPFLFVNEEHLLVEERGCAWPHTIIPNDFYPSVAITLCSANAAIGVIGDFDTGASSSFIDYDWLVRHNLIQLQMQEEAESSHHLNRAYEYLPRRFVIEMVSAERETRTSEMTIACVADWQNSPFAMGNPERVALIGRD